MTTAIEKWGASQEGAGDHTDGHAEAHADMMHEGDITGADDLAADDAAPADAVPANADDAALAAKKAKDKRIMLIGGAVVGVIGLAVAASVMFRPAAHPQAIAAASQSQVASEPLQAPVAAPVAEAAIAPVAADPASPAQPLVAAAEPMPMPMPMAAAPAVAASQEPSPLAAPVAAAPALAAVEPTPQGAPVNAELEQLKATVQALRADVDSKSRDIAALRKDIAAARAQAAARPAPVRKVVEVPVIVERERAPRAAAVAPAVEPRAQMAEPAVFAEPKQTPLAPPAVAKGGKVRSEFTVYAISNGRAWVTWAKDGMNYTVSANSELPDYSKVTALDDVKGVVFTSAGEIHPKPPTR